MTSSKAHKWYKDWLAWLLIAVVFYSVICLTSLASDVGRPFPGFFTYHNFILARLDIVRNAPAWWWGLSTTEPAITDTLIQVEDTPFDSLTTPLNERLVYEQAWRAGKKTVNIVVERDGNRYMLDVPLIPFSWRYYLDFTFAPIVISSVLWLLAWLLYRAAPTHPTQRLTAALLCLIAVQPVGIQPSLFQYDQPLDRILSIGNVTTTAAGLLMSVFFYQVTLQFPYPLTNRFFKAGTWVMSCLAALGFSFYMATRLTVYTQGITTMARRLDQLYLYSFIGPILLGVVAITIRMIVDSFFLLNQKRHQQEAQILLVALLLMLPTFWLIGQHLSGHGQSLSSLRILADTRFFALTLPLAFAAISLRYHTFAGAESWFFLALLLAGSGVLANVGTALLFWNSLSLLRETAIPPTIILFLLLFCVGGLWGWQASWRGWLGRVFQWERINYQIVQQVGQELLQAQSHQEATITKTIADVLCIQLEVERTAVWVQIAEQLMLIAQAGTWHVSPPPTFPSLPNISQSSQHARDDLFTDVITAVVPLTLSGKLLGVIAIGPRWDTAVFDNRDLEILDLIAQQAALFLHNAHQTTQLRHADQQLLAAYTQTRRKIAQDLHDHLLPTLSRLQLNLLTTATLIDTQPTQAQQVLHTSQQDLSMSTDLIRRIQQDLVNRPLEYGLHAYLIDMVHRFHRETSTVVAQSLPPNLDERVYDIRQRETLYAIWQQALDNIRRHAQATHVTITLELDESKGTFVICDNGQGSSMAERQEASRTGHFGLRSMQIRLEAIGGQLQFESQSGRGSCLSGFFPLTGNKGSSESHDKSS